MRIPLALIFVFLSLEVCEARPSRALGVVELNESGGGSVIPVRGVCPSLANPQVSSIGLQALQSVAAVDHIAVRYSNGEEVRLYVRHEISQGAKGSWIDLGGGRRCIDQIRVVGTGKIASSKAVIEILGAR